MDPKVRKKGKELETLSVIIMLSIIITSSIFVVDAATPQGPDVLNISTNETKGSVGAKMVNISGGYIASMNLSATVQNIRWKAFVGQVTGLFTLDDASGSTIFDWTLTSITGRIYATRNSSSITWSNINCSNLAFLENENYKMNHTNANDNITATFNMTAGATHGGFFAAGVEIFNNSCPTLNTYIDNATQDTYFQEMVLDDDASVVYATIIETDHNGFDSTDYDFQMIVPENGAAGFSGATAYYIYVELD